MADSYIVAQLRPLVCWCNPVFLNSGPRDQLLIKLCSGLIRSHSFESVVLEEGNIEKHAGQWVLRTGIEKHWCNPNYSTKWKDLELRQSETPAQSLLSICQHHDPYLDKINCWTRPTLKVWSYTSKKLQLEKHAKILKWVAYDSEFLPSGLDKRFRQWTHNGITAYCPIADKDGLLSRFRFDSCLVLSFPVLF